MSEEHLVTPAVDDDTLTGLIRNWSFIRSSPTLVARLARIKTAATGFRAAPPSQVLRTLVRRDRWNGYFLYLPDGRLTSGHRHTLSRLRTLHGGLFVVCAAPEPAMVPPELLAVCDAAIWKGTSGYDFSAYSLAMREVARSSPGADLLLMNDSVLGPFGDIDSVLRTAPWRVTGFTAWSAFENHVQSYALHFRDVTPDLISALRSVLLERTAFNRFQDVVNWQESRLARVASQAMTVGALWFEPRFEAGDPSLVRAASLLRAGFPFLKRSLVGGKLAHRADQETLLRLLDERGHPAL